MRLVCAQGDARHPESIHTLSQPWNRITTAAAAREHRPCMHGSFAFFSACTRWLVDRHACPWQSLETPWQSMDTIPYKSMAAPSRPASSLAPVARKLHGRAGIALAARHVRTSCPPASPLSSLVQPLPQPALLVFAFSSWAGPCSGLLRAAPQYA